jgi:hypothetical protein
LKIILKAEYLLKMQVPTAARFQETNEDDSVILYRMPSFVADE